MARNILLPILILACLGACESADSRKARELGQSYGYDEISDIDDLADNLMDDHRCGELKKLGYHDLAQQCYDNR